MRESAIETAFCRRVSALGGEVRKVKWLDRNGAPDRVAMADDGCLVWVELKQPNGGLSAQQKLEHARLRRRGQRVDVIWNIEDANNWRF